VDVVPKGLQASKLTVDFFLVPGLVHPLLYLG